MPETGLGQLNRTLNKADKRLHHAADTLIEGDRP